SVAQWEAAVGASYDRDKFCFFFFQAEDGIRDKLVTGVQTCALPILMSRVLALAFNSASWACNSGSAAALASSRCANMRLSASDRSEERRVGKECRSRWWGWQ